MGRFVDLNQPLSEEDKEYLRNRGRGYLIPANERRFGVDGTETPAEHESSGSAAQSPFYNTDQRAAAVYDTGGAPLPGATLDYDTGRAFDRENGVLVEPRQAGHTPGANPSPWGPEGFAERDEDDSDIDEDIADEVNSYTVPQLKDHLDKAKVAYEPTDKKSDLQDLLAIHLQDKRDGKK